MRDVIVVGGGPSGLNAAARLAADGFDVELLEAKSKIGQHVICTGIVGREAFKEFELSGDSILHTIQRIRVHSPQGDSIEYEHPTPFACVVSRYRFDNHLAEKARRRGAEIRVGYRVQDLSIQPDRVDLKVRNSAGSVSRRSSRVVMIATGINYFLHHRLGLGIPKDFLSGVQAELEFDQLDCTQVFLGRKVAWGAFGWAVPIGGRVRVGLMTEGDAESHFNRLLEKWRPRNSLEKSRDLVQYKAIAQGLVSKTFGERILAVGEAAGQVKTTTGGGIYFGLLCSSIAVDVLKECFRASDFSESAMSEYEKRWKKRLRKEIRLGYQARKLCARLSDAQIDRLFRIARNDGVIPMIREQGNFDWHGELTIKLLRRVLF